MIDKVSSLDEAKLRLIGAIQNNIISMGLGWSSVPGNSLVISYFAGVAARNPSGTVGNLDTILYQTDGVTIRTKEFTYDISDNVVLISTT